MEIETGRRGHGLYRLSLPATLGDPAIGEHRQPMVA